MTASNPNKNDVTWTPAALKETRIPSAAPKPEPYDAARISGDTIGFLKSP